MKKRFFWLALILLLSFSFGAAADELSSYRIQSEGQTYYVHYDGLVPCGKDVWVGQDSSGLNAQKVHMPCQFCHLFVMLAGIVGFLLTRLIPLLAVAMLIMAGVMYYLALGDPGKVKKANSLFKGVLLGLFLIYGAWLIIGALFSIIGVAEWTGLQAGWYQIDCPVKYVVYEPKDIELPPADICDGNTGLFEINGMPVVCTPHGAMTRSFRITENPPSGSNYYEMAVAHCRSLSSPPGKVGSWRLPTLLEYKYWWSNQTDLMKCGPSCEAWDNGCCQGGWGGEQRWYFTNEVTGQRVQIVNMVNASSTANVLKNRERNHRCVWKE